MEVVAKLPNSNKGVRLGQKQNKLVQTNIAAQAVTGYFDHDILPPPNRSMRRVAIITENRMIPDISQNNFLFCEPLSF